MIFIDCTLRDGGYYTKWDFEPSLVDRYLRAVAAAQIDFVEIGLRNFSQEGFLGPFAYSTEYFLSQLDVTHDLRLGVMVDAKTLLGAGIPIEEAVNELFLPKNDSKIQLVRVAAHFGEVDQCGGIVGLLKDLGYLVGVNLMQASGKPGEAIVEKLETLLSYDKKPDVLYFADSLGNMDTVEVSRLYQLFRKVWPGPIGIHTHNNQGLAASNSIYAESIGVSWLDATIQGMGRGAGNAEMEILLTEIGERHGKNAKALYEIAIEDFSALRQQYHWGPNLMYYFSAKHGIHPTYAQELLADDRYSGHEKVSIIQQLADVTATSFSEALYASALTRQFANSIGSWDATNAFDGREVLIVAAGPTARRYARDIVGFAEHRGVELLTVNFLNNLPKGAVDGVISVDQNRIRFEADHWKNLRKPIYSPMGCLPDDCVSMLKSLDVRDFGLSVERDSFELNPCGCVLPFALSAIYGISVALQGGAKHIYLAGFDGYSAGDPRQAEMTQSLDLLRSKIDLDNRITAITPTAYPLKQGSLYAP